MNSVRDLFLPMGWVSAIPQISALTIPAHLIVKRLCNCLTAFTLSVGVLADYRKWPLQDPYPPLLGISARMASWYRLWPLPIPGLWHLLEIAPNPLPANLPSFPDLSTYFIPHPLFHPVPHLFWSPKSILFSLLRKNQTSFLVPSLLFSFFASVDYSMVIL